MLEFHHEEETFARLLLLVTPDSLYPENKLTKAVPKDTVYIQKSIAESFHLSNYKSLVVNKVTIRKTLYLCVFFPYPPCPPPYRGGGGWKKQ